jgi:hypothetical protein
MKVRVFSIIFFPISFLIVLALLSGSAKAQELQPLAPPQDYLVALPVSLPDPAAIPVGLSPEAAVEYARILTERQAGPILAELERLRAEGLIAGFEVRPDLHGVVVVGAKA